MDRYYERAHEHCECGRYIYDARQALPQGHRPFIPGFESADVDQNGLWRFSLPTDFGKRSKAVIKASSRMRVYLHANCLGLITDSEGGHIVGVRAASLGRNEFVVRAKYYVLAAGCLENSLWVAWRPLAARGAGVEGGAVERAGV